MAKLTYPTIFYLFLKYKLTFFTKTCQAKFYPLLLKVLGKEKFLDRGEG